TDERSLKDEFFTNTNLYNPTGKNIMILGLALLPEYQKQGLAKELMSRYLQKEHKKDRKMVVLTCLESKVKMYEKMGFENHGIGESTWGAEQWYEMSCVLNM
ncbi:MAG: GNAT family N-acetyltransferase, partial [Lachnospiraceae bacterium]